MCCGRCWQTLTGKLPFEFASCAYCKSGVLREHERRLALACVCAVLKCVCAQVCMFVSVCARVCVYACVYVWVHVYVCICQHVCACVRTCCMCCTHVCARQCQFAARNAARCPSLTHIAARIYTFRPMLLTLSRCVWRLYYLVLHLCSQLRTLHFLFRRACM